MGRPRFKVYINVYIKRISGLEKFEGRYMYIEWTRGGKLGQSSKQTGLTRKSLVRDGVAIFDEHIEFCGTLIQSSKGGFNQKFFALNLHEFVSTESKKKPFILKYKMNITEYIKKINEKLTATIPINSDISLEVVVSSRLISSKTNDGSDSEDDEDDEEEEEEEEDVGGGGGDEDDDEGTSGKRKDSREKRKSKMITESGGDAGDGGDDKDGDESNGKKKKKKGSSSSSSSTKKGKGKGKDKKKKKKKSKEKKGSDDDNDDDEDSNDDEDENESAGTDTLSFGGIYSGFGEFTSSFSEKDNQAIIESLRREVEMLKKENRDQEQRIAELKSKMADLKLHQQSKTTDMDEKIIQFKRKEEEAAAAEASENAMLKGRHLKRQAASLNLIQKGGSRKSLSVSIQQSGAGSPLTTSSSSSANGEEVSQLEELKDLISFINSEIYLVQPKISDDNLPASSNIIFDKLMECNALRKDDPQKFLSKVLYSIDCALVSCEGNLEKSSYWLSTFCRILVLVRKLLSDDTLDKDDRLTRHEIGFECFSLRLKTVYSDIIRTVLLDVRRSFVPAVIKSDDEALNCGSLPQARGPRPFDAMRELVINPLQQSLNTLKANAVPQSVTLQIFTQVCYTMCAVVFNYVMRHKEVNTAEMGLKIKMELAKFRDWAHRAGLAKAYDALTPLEEATIVMVAEKSIFSDSTILASICPSLSLAQVRIILSAFGDQVSQDIIFGLKSQSASEDTEEMDETFVNRISYDFLETSQ